MFILAWLYGCIVNLRNWLFDTGALPSRTFPLPVIGVGNLTVGGTGKTPHTEMLVEMLLGQGLRVATLSRGYKRKTRGFRLVSDTSTAYEVGDEPLQMKWRFPEATVAVDEDRCHGIESLDGMADVIVLDDAYQHRYVKPSLNILLVNHDRPIFTDHLLPRGRLREPQRGKYRADIVIVTKCPATMSPIDFRVLEQNLGLRPYQRIFFTTLSYGDMQPLFADTPALPLKHLRQMECTLILTGIANPDRLRQDLTPYCQRIKTLTYSDHHIFTASDAESINSALRGLRADECVIITTAKDATRLRLIAEHLSPEVRRALHVLPVQVEFLRSERAAFTSLIEKHLKT